MIGKLYTYSRVQLQSIEVADLFGGPSLINAICFRLPDCLGVEWRCTRAFLYQCYYKFCEHLSVLCIIGDSAENKKGVIFFSIPSIICLEMGLI